jgi:hypothetical protein
MMAQLSRSIKRNLSVLLLGGTFAVTGISPAYADLVNQGDTGGANYVGLDWRFVNLTTQDASNEAGVPSLSFEADYNIFVTVRISGKTTCNDEIDISADALSYSGKTYTLCGQPTVFAENQNRLYYRVPGVIDGWVDSPARCYYAGGINYTCDHYWYTNWGAQPPPSPTPPPRKAPPAPECPKPVPGRLSFCP